MLSSEGHSIADQQNPSKVLLIEREDELDVFAQEKRKFSENNTKMNSKRRNVRGSTANVPKKFEAVEIPMSQNKRIVAKPVSRRSARDRAMDVSEDERRPVEIPTYRNIEQCIGVTPVREERTMERPVEIPMYTNIEQRSVVNPVESPTYTNIEENSKTVESPVIQNSRNDKRKSAKRVEGIVRRETPRKIKLTEGKEGTSVDRVVDLTKTTVVPVTIADLLEMSPAFKQKWTREMRGREDDPAAVVLAVEESENEGSAESELEDSEQSERSENEESKNSKKENSGESENEEKSDDDEYEDEYVTSFQKSIKRGNAIEVTDRIMTPAIGKAFARIAGYRVLAAIDPGADVSLMHSEVMNRLGLVADTESRLVLNGFGSSIKPSKSITNLPIEMSSVSIPLTFEITDKSPYPILLGRDWTYLANAQTDWRSGIMRITYRGKVSMINMYAIGSISYRERWKEPMTEDEEDKENIKHIENGQNDVKQNNELDMLFAEKAEAIYTHKDWHELRKDAVEFGFLIPSKSYEQIEVLECESTEISETEITIGDAFDDMQKKRLKSLLDKYATIFGESICDMRRLNTTPMKIEVGETRPIKSHGYRIPIHQLPVLKKLLAELVDQGIIIRKESEWSAPLLMVKKKDNTWRLVTDYRKLNDAAIKDAGEVPIIQDLIDRTCGSTIFSTMDCRSGFWQWSIDRDSIDKTGFSTPFGSFCYVVCPMGFTNAAQGFHRVVTSIFDDMLTVSVEVIIDDVLVHSASAETHLIDLEKAFERAAAANMLFRRSKTKLGLSKITIWAWVISADGISADPSRVSKLKEWPTPTTVKEIRRFIGFIQYYRRIIPNFSEVSACLTDLQKGDGRTRVKLNAEQLEKFKFIKQLLTSETIVKLPDPEKQFYVKTDAGPRAVGGVLTQFHDNIEYPVAYMSAKLNIHERNYGQTKKELLAVVVAFRQWRHYLLGANNQIVLVTDCTAVRDLMTKKHISGIFARWVLELQEFKFRTEYKPGNRHADADALSRMFDQQNIQDQDDIDIEKIDYRNREDVTDHVENVREAYFTEADESKLETIRTFLNDPSHLYGNNTVNAEKMEKLSRRFTVDQNGKLLRVHKDGIPRKVLMTREEINEELEFLHSSAFGGHLGIQNTYKRISLRVWWTRMGADIEKYIKNCKICQIRDRRREEEFMPRITSTAIFEKWGGDCIGPLTSANGYTSIVLWTDYHSKWVAGRAIRNMNSASIATSLLRDVILEHGAPREIVTDRGGAFIGETMRELREMWSVKGIKTTAYNPRSNGQAERTNQSVINVLAKLSIQYEKKWPEMLPFALWVVNTRTNRSTASSPFFLKYGVEARLPTEMQWEDEELGIEDAIMRRVAQIENLRGKRSEVRERLQLGYDKRVLLRENDPKIRRIPLVEGNQVLLWRSELDKQWSVAKFTAETRYQADF
jgi:hypothetical protein